MSKSPEAFRTISEVAEQLDVPAHVLRFWETRFTQIKPVKRGGGRRYYRPDDVRLLRGIRGLLYDEGLTIKGVQKLLREQGIRHVIAHGAALEAAEEAAPPARREPALAAADGNGAAEPFDLFSRGGEHGDRPPSSVNGAAADHAAPADGDGPDGPAAAARPSVDRDALRGLVRRLEALRTEMAGSPSR